MGGCASRLHPACYGCRSLGHANCVDLLRSGWTPLHRAALRGHAGCVEVLLRAGADKNAKTKEGWTPLHFAAWGERTKCVELLLRAGADKDAKNKGGYTPLHRAAEDGRKECVKLLVFAEADLFARVFSGKNALDMAQDATIRDFLRRMMWWKEFQLLSVACGRGQVLGVMFRYYDPALWRVVNKYIY